MHDNVGDAPKPPEHNHPDMPQLTAPSLACLTPEEQATLHEIGCAIIEGLKPSSSELLLAMALERLVSLGAHMVGHGLNTLVWSSFQAFLVANGQPPHDDAEAMVILAPQGEALTEADVKMADMVTEFVKASLAGAHASAIGVWADWIETLGEGDWDRYVEGVVAIIKEANSFARGVMQKDEEASEMLGRPMARLIPRQQS